MTGSILIRNVMTINDGSLEPFSTAVCDAVDFARQHGPQQMVRTFIDRQAMQLISLQLYRNSQDVLRHWALADPHIQNVSQHGSVATLDVYGAPDAEVAAGLRPFLGDGRGRIIAPLTGFSRF